VKRRYEGVLPYTLHNPLATTRQTGRKKTKQGEEFYITEGKGQSHQNPNVTHAEMVKFELNFIYFSPAFQTESDSWKQT
jgi:hypothetical protein